MSATHGQADVVPMPLTRSVWWPKGRPPINGYWPIVELDHRMMADDANFVGWLHGWVLKGSPVLETETDSVVDLAGPTDQLQIVQVTRPGGKSDYSHRLQVFGDRQDCPKDYRGGIRSLLYNDEPGGQKIYLQPVWLTTSGNGDMTSLQMALLANRLLSVCMAQRPHIALENLIEETLVCHFVHEEVWYENKLMSKFSWLVAVRQSADIGQLVRWNGLAIAAGAQNRAAGLLGRACTSMRRMSDWTRRHHQLVSLETPMD